MKYQDAKVNRIEPQDIAETVASIEDDYRNYNVSLTEWCNGAPSTLKQGALKKIAQLWAKLDKESYNCEG